LIACIPFSRFENICDWRVLPSENFEMKEKFGMEANDFEQSIRTAHAEFVPRFNSEDDMQYSTY
jgi:hypothetical protein